MGTSSPNGLITEIGESPSNIIITGMSPDPLAAMMVISLDEDIGSDNIVVLESLKFVLLTNEAIGGFKVDELRGDLTKRSLSKGGLTAELTERLKKL